MAGRPSSAYLTFMRGGAPYSRATAQFTPLPIRTARDAEENARRWLEHVGFAACVLTAKGADDGVDVRGRGVIAQVKAQAVPVGLDVVQRTYGCAQAERAVGAVFGMKQFTVQARRWADTYGVALFSFDLSGTPVAENDCAAQLGT